MRLFLITILLVAGLNAKNYTQKYAVKLFVNNLVQKHNFNRTKLNRLFASVKYQKRALSVYVPSLRPIVKRPKNYKKPKKSGSWDRYEGWLLKESRVRKGVEYMQKHKRTLKRAYQEYGVPPEYITAIIGIESYYGGNTGKFPVFDTLTTLSFEPNRRNKFFRSQLKAFLIMTKENKINPKAIKGSIAGAIGLSQFMPSNYKSLAVDFNNDGKKEMNNHIDAIGSIAHYFKKSHWQKGKPVAVRVKYSGKRYNRLRTGYKYKYNRASLRGIAPITHFDYKGKVHLIKLKRLEYDELWYGAKNFFVITRYNHSNYYAMAVHQLAQKIKKRYSRRYAFGVDDGSDYN